MSLKAERQVMNGGKIIPFGCPDEAAILAGMRDGRDEAFRALYDLYSCRVYRLALRFLGDEGGARNVVQETFLAVFRKIHGFRHDASLGTWLYRIASNLCLNDLSRRKRDRETQSSLAENEILHEQCLDHPLETIARQDLVRHVLRCVEGLEDRKKMTFLLFYVEEMTADEIAEILGEGRGTVLKRLQRIREEMIRRLGQDEAWGAAWRKIKAGQP